MFIIKETIFFNSCEDEDEVFNECNIIGLFSKLEFVYDWLCNNNYKKDESSIDNNTYILKISGYIHYAVIEELKFIN